MLLDTLSDFSAAKASELSSFLALSAESFSAAGEVSAGFSLDDVGAGSLHVVAEVSLDDVGAGSSDVVAEVSLDVVAEVSVEAVAEGSLDVVAEGSLDVVTGASLEALLAFDTRPRPVDAL